MMFWALVPLALAQENNDTNPADSVCAGLLSSIDVSAWDLGIQYSSFTATTSVAVDDSNYQSLQGLTQLLLQLGSTLRSTQPDIDPGQLGDALDSLSQLFVTLAFEAGIVEGPVAYELPNLANGALEIVSDVAGMPGFGCSQLATWTVVASLYEAAEILSSVWSFNALINSNLGGFCSDLAMTSVNVGGPGGSLSRTASDTADGKPSDASSQVEVSGSASAASAAGATSGSKSTSSNAARSLGPQFWSFVLLL